MRVSYCWVIVGAGALMTCVAIGAMFSLAVFLEPMSRATGWSRAGISSAMTLNFIIMGFGAFGWGAASDRFGTRTVVLIGAALLGLTTDSAASSALGSPNRTEPPATAASAATLRGARRPPCREARPAPPASVKSAGGPADNDVTSFDGTRLRIHARVCRAAGGAISRSTGPRTGSARGPRRPARVPPPAVT